MQSVIFYPAMILRFVDTPVIKERPDVVNIPLHRTFIDLVKIRRFPLSDYFSFHETGIYVQNTAAFAVASLLQFSDLLILIL